MHEGSVYGSARPGRESSAYFSRPVVAKPARTRYAHISQASGAKDTSVPVYDDVFGAAFSPGKATSATATTAHRPAFRKRLFIPAAAAMTVIAGVGVFTLTGSPDAPKDAATKPVAATSASGRTTADRSPSTPVSDTARKPAESAEAQPAAAPEAPVAATTYQSRPRPAPSQLPAATALAPSLPAVEAPPQVPAAPSQPAAEADTTTGVTDENTATDGIGSIGNAGGGSTPEGDQTGQDTTTTNPSAPTD